MNPDLKKHSAYLTLLTQPETTKQQRTALLKSMSLGQLKIICEIILNIGLKNIDMTEQEKQQLSSYKPTFEFLSDKHRGWNKKRLRLLKKSRVCYFYLNYFFQKL
ncbi:unnamed protein product [Owenia fusiformis]|uniref:Uncharacterized protein n=1 Tax=Owenia fusiformis TaxID=6347 RepID=A0A8J1Y2M8_OWEFU|nr:unnamed protein product [Owenia fusiformis]